MTDQPTPEDEIILEPGDPGYVDPNAPSEPEHPRAGRRVNFPH
jgi:hypothetical protein